MARLCRFLKGLLRMVQCIPFEDHPPSIIKTYVYSDWAGCRKSRKSTSGGVIYFGEVVVRAWSENQAVIALSSGEAEYYAALKGASPALGFQSMLRHFGNAGIDNPVYGQFCSKRNHPPRRSREVAASGNRVLVVAGRGEVQEAADQESVGY